MDLYTPRITFIQPVLRLVTSLNTDNSYGVICDEYGSVKVCF